MGTIGGITKVLCVIFLQFIGFSLKKKAFMVFTSETAIFIREKVLLRCPHFIGGGVPPNLGNARI